jgi:hypothetical protein
LAISADLLRRAGQIQPGRHLAAAAVLQDDFYSLSIFKNHIIKDSPLNLGKDST